MKLKRFLLKVVEGVFTLLMVSCNVNGNSANPVKGKITINYWGMVNSETNATIQSIKNEYNAKNNDNVYVNFIPQSAGYSSQIASALRSATPPDIVEIEEKYFKGYAESGYLTNLEKYITDEDKEQGNFDFNDIYPSLVNRFRYNVQTGDCGGNNPLLAMPQKDSTTFIYYNVTQFNERKVNIISIDEENIDSYNRENGTSYNRHGFYAYDTSPANGLHQFTDNMKEYKGKYLVFNNKISTNWEEIRDLSKIFTKEYNSLSTSKYGFMNEWWFSYGWSIGGDCLEWDDEKSQYIFTLGDETSNWLVTGKDGVIINRTTYFEGDLLNYNDKNYVESVQNSLIDDKIISEYLLNQKIYQLPSIYDAFTEFCRLSQTTSKSVSIDKNGYGISPSPTTLNQKGKTIYFTSGEVAMLCSESAEMNTINQTFTRNNQEWDVAPLYQYKEYNKDGSIKMVNGTEIKGRRAAHDISVSLAIPSKSKRASSAIKFIKYLVGKEAQKSIITTNQFISVLKSVNEGEYLNNTIEGCANNKEIVADAVNYSSVGDWSYVENGEWINGWANILNTSVRDGNMTLDQFFKQSTVIETDQILKNYKSKKYSGR